MSCEECANFIRCKQKHRLFERILDVLYPCNKHTETLDCYEEVMLNAPRKY